MASRRGAARKKARSAPAADDRPVHGLDVLFQPTALPKHLQGLTEPELYLSSSSGAAAQARRATKALFDYANEALTNASGPLPEMVVDGFDDEQIWQEINLQNDAVLKYAQTTLEKLKSREKMAEQAAEKVAAKRNSKAARETDEGASEEGDEFGDPSDENSEGLSDGVGSRSAAASSAEEATRESAKPQPKDLFFNLNEMTEFLEDAERRAEKGDDDDDEEEEDDADIGDAADIRYADFFDAPPKQARGSKHAAPAPEEEEEEDDDEENLGGEAEDDEEGEEGEKGSLDDLGSDEMPGDAEDDSEILNDESDDDEGGSGGDEGDGEDENSDETKKPSQFERDAKKLAVRISRLEEVNIGEKPWTLLGEATSKSRPVGSLLEEDLDYETATKQAPVITPEVTKSLEELIRGRIKQTMFDDPIRKTEADMPKYRPKVQLNEEKSKKGLGELYEEEYLRQTNDAGEKTDRVNPQHEEISALFKQLCYKLDALSNFHYTPKPPKEELKILPNVAAIQMEEVLPIAVSKGRTLAPQEVYAHKKAVEKGSSEMTHDDRKRKRKKIKQTHKKQEAEKVHRQRVREAINPAAKKQATEKEALADIKKGGKNVVVGKKTTSSKETKSTTFFAKLQEQTQSGAAGRKPLPTTQKDKFAAQASFLKL